MDMDKHGCNKCGSINLINRGYSITAAGVKEKKCQCKDCGAWTSVKIEA